MQTDTHCAPTEHLIAEACDLLRCARATAYEHADDLHGSQRDHAMAVVHLIDMTRSKIDAVLRRTCSQEYAGDRILV